MLAVAAFNIAFFCLIGNVSIAPYYFQLIMKIM